MTKRSIVTAVFLVVFVVGFTAGHVQADQTHMHAALRHLRDARHELEIATADKGGHRAKAIELCDMAIAETERGIEYARVH